MTALRRALAAIVAAAPDWLRHAGIVFASAAAGVVLDAIIGAGGVTGVEWPAVVRTALDTGASATAAGLALLTATPATRRYGVGSGGKHVAQERAA